MYPQHLYFSRVGHTHAVLCDPPILSLRAYQVSGIFQ